MESKASDSAESIWHVDKMSYEKEQQAFGTDLEKKYAQFEHSEHEADTE